MFFKEVRDKNKTPGRVYVYYMLVRSFRDEQGVSRDKVLLNAGRLPYNRTQLRWLAKRIDEILSGRVALRDSPSDELEHKAHELAARVLERQLKTSPAGETTSIPDIISFDRHRLQTEDPRSVAGEQILATLAHTVGLPEIFQRAGLQKRESKLATALVVAYALAPVPLPQLAHRLIKHSAAGEVLAEPCHGLTSEEVIRLARKLARRRLRIAAALNSEAGTTDPGRLGLLDFRHLFTGPGHSRWLLGLQLGPHALPRLAVLIRLDGEHPAHLFDTVATLNPAGRGDSPLVVLKHSRPHDPLTHYVKSISRPYMVLETPAARTIEAIRRSNPVRWISKDGEWFLLKRSASSLPEKDKENADPGSVLLRTNLPERELERLSHAVANLAEVENDVDALQPASNDLHDQPTPVFEAQLFLTYLALTLLQAFRTKLPQTERCRPWHEFRELFTSQTRLTIRLPDPFGNHTHYIRTTTHPGDDLAQLYRCLGLNPDLLGNRYFVV